MGGLISFRRRHLVRRKSCEDKPFANGDCILKLNFSHMLFNSPFMGKEKYSAYLLRLFPETSCGCNIRISRKHNLNKESLYVQFEVYRRSYSKFQCRVLFTSSNAQTQETYKMKINCLFHECCVMFTFLWQYILGFPYRRMK